MYVYIYIYISRRIIVIHYRRYFTIDAILLYIVYIYVISHLTYFCCDQRTHSSPMEDRKGTRHMAGNASLFQRGPFGPMQDDV